MNRFPYDSDIGLIMYAIIFTCSDFSKCLGHWEGKGLECGITKVVKQIPRTFWCYTKGLIACGHLKV